MSSGLTVAFHSTILVSDVKHDRILRFATGTGALIDTFVSPESGGLKRPRGLAFGPDRNLFVASEGTKSILKYHGSTGAFIQECCHVGGAPKGITFHYDDLYVSGGSDRTIYRFNGWTLSPRGIFAATPALAYPWSIVFDKNTNNSLVSDMTQHQLLKFNPPRGGFDAVNSEPMGSNNVRASYARRWSNRKLSQVRNFDLTSDSLYATSPSLGYVAAQFNRTTGEHRSNFKDVGMVAPSDLKVHENTLFVCGEGEIRKYNRFDGEYLGTFIRADMACSFMIFHTSWDMARGK